MNLGFFSNLLSMRLTKERVTRLDEKLKFFIFFLNPSFSIFPNFPSNLQLNPKIDTDPPLVLQQLSSLLVLLKNENQMKPSYRLVLRFISQLVDKTDRIVRLYLNHVVSIISPVLART